MTRIGIISDTHGYLAPLVFDTFEDCDEVWHAGDFGDKSVAQKLMDFKPLRGVYGNIDGRDIHNLFGEQEVFFCEKVKVLMRHIGGYPPKYNPETRRELLLHRPSLMVTGHSHILKIMYDDSLHCLHINPGAAGRQGWHKVKTLVRLDIDGKEMKNCRIIEL